MGRVAIVGCEHSDTISQDDIVLVEALIALGVDVDRPIWNDDRIDWSAYDLAVVRTTWDYHLQPVEFSNWISHVSEVTRLMNEARTLQWNMHKSYLVDLSRRGIPVVPTQFVVQGSSVIPDEVFGWKKVVIKPAISASANDTLAVELSQPEASEHLRKVCSYGDALIQPFLTAIQDGYEISLVYIDGEFTHAARKRVKSGDFRVQMEYGGTYEIVSPTAEERATADKAIAALEDRPLCARVDLCKTETGQDVLMELELIEPELWLYESDLALNRLATKIRDLVHS